MRFTIPLTAPCRCTNSTTAAQNASLVDCSQKDGRLIDCFMSVVPKLKRVELQKTGGFPRLVTGWPWYEQIYTHDIFQRNLSSAPDMKLICDRDLQSASLREKYS